MSAAVDTHNHHVDINFTTPTAPPVHRSASASPSSVINLTTLPPKAPQYLPLTDGVVIDLTHEDKVIYDLTGIE
jgi:hypothetical protein